MVNRYQNRSEAGQRVAQALKAQVPEAAWTNGIVLALPRGGVPVGAEIADALGLPLDVWLVRKLGVPGQSELAMGALALPKSRFLNSTLVTELNISADQVEAITQQEHQELKRRNQAYRQEKPLPQVENRPIVLVDDGIATGATMRVAIAALRSQQPTCITVAVPVASPSSLEVLAQQVDHVVCPLCPESMHSISLWYEQFPQTSDTEVQQTLQRYAAWSPTNNGG